ncbi:MAG: hypothetical protein AAF945_10360 [Actinomycetota bacterium]
MGQTGGRRRPSSGLGRVRSATSLAVAAVLALGAAWASQADETPASAAVATVDSPATASELAERVNPPPSNPIEVPTQFLGDANNPGDAKCKFVDLHTVAPPPNPGFVGEALGDESVDGQTMWEVAFYLMLYANCERQARGIAPLEMWSGDLMVELQSTVLGISQSHGGFGERSDMVGGATAEQHGGTLLVGIVSHSPTADDDDDDLWSPHEVARRSASGRQHNDTVGLVDHGGAMIDPNKRCIFGAASLGPTADARMDVILFYGSTC